MKDKENLKDKEKKDVPPKAEQPQEEQAEKKPQQDKDEKSKTENPQEDVQALLAEEKDKYLRLAAEYDNFRKRSQKEREALYADIRSDTVLKFLPVYDNLQRALKHQCADEAFVKGVEMTMDQLKQILNKLGVTEIEAVGKKFDPAMHNAVMHIEDDAYGEGIVVEEFEKGFMLEDKVVRFSMVKVAN